MLSVILEQARNTSLAEAFAAALGLAYLLLAVKRSLACWICAFASTGIYLVLFAKASLYMQSALQVFYLVMAVYGFIDWKRGRTESGDVRIESWNVYQHVTVALLVIMASALNGWALSRCRWKC